MTGDQRMREITAGSDAGWDWRLLARANESGGVQLSLEVPSANRRSGGVMGVGGQHSLAYGVGVGSTGPRRLTVCTGPGVATVVAAVDGRHEPVPLHADPAGKFQAKVGARLFARRSQISALIAYDADGTEVARDVPDHETPAVPWLVRWRQLTAWLTPAGRVSP